jgi:hypothetical protein
VETILFLLGCAVALVSLAVFAEVFGITRDQTEDAHSGLRLRR